MRVCLSLALVSLLASASMEPEAKTLDKTPTAENTETKTGMKSEEQQQQGVAVMGQQLLKYAHCCFFNDFDENAIKVFQISSSSCNSKFETISVTPFSQTGLKLLAISAAALAPDTAVIFTKFIIFFVCILTFINIFERFC